ncbi:MAG: type II secretion system protein [Symploca sp. SIO2B6]|nr:type II secretion system protein [Symploca sp. SIO2B6]
MGTTTILNILQKLYSTRASTKQKYLGIKRLHLESNSGFTLLELIMVILIIGVLSTIAAPGWLAFTNRQRVNKVNDAVLSVLQDAQSDAKRRKLSYGVNFRKNNEDNSPEVAVYLKETAPNPLPWESLLNDLEVKPGQVQLDEPPEDQNQITFDYQGNVENEGDIPFIVKVSVPDSSVKRCVIVQTIIGTMKTDKGENCENNENDDNNN